MVIFRLTLLVCALCAIHSVQSIEPVHRTNLPRSRSRGGEAETILKSFNRHRRSANRICSELFLLRKKHQFKPSEEIGHRFSQAPKKIRHYHLSEAKKACVRYLDPKKSIPHAALDPYNVIAGPNGFIPGCTYTKYKEMIYVRGADRDARNDQCKLLCSQGLSDGKECLTIFYEHLDGHPYCLLDDRPYDKSALECDHNDVSYYVGFARTSNPDKFKVVIPQTNHCVYNKYISSLRVSANEVVGVEECKNLCSTKLADGSQCKTAVYEKYTFYGKVPDSGFCILDNDVYKESEKQCQINEVLYVVGFEKVSG